MSKSKLIEQIIEAIDQGHEIDIDWERAANAEEYKQIKALLAVHQISRRINQQQEAAISRQFKTGDQWMHLIIKEKIGAGGFGQVFRAYDSVLQTDVAVKFLNQRITGIDDADFLHEARLMATVRNPHVLAIHGAAQDKGVAGYWTDYLDGEILYKFLQSHSIDDDTKASIIKDITLAVKATHKNGVIHGDIKSLNVMLQPNRGAILLDFGSGRAGLNNDENKLLMQASPIAMAPEQFAGEGNSQAADVFALGLLIVEVLTGQHPFANLSLEQIKSTANMLPQTLGNLRLSRGWRSLLVNMLSVDIKYRPSIETVIKKIIAIEERPLKRAKQVAVATMIALLVGVSGSSLYSYFNIKQANQQTEVINSILYDNFLTLSPHKEGKAVTLVQVMNQVGDKVLNNNQLSPQNQEMLLVRMVGTYLTLSDLQQVIILGEQVLALPNLETLSRMKVMRYVGLAHSHQREFDVAEAQFKAILELSATTEDEYDAQLKVINPLVFGYLNHNQFDQVPPLLKKLDQLQPFGTNRPIMLGAAEHTKALYYSRINEIAASTEAYIKAAEYFSEHYHAEHYSVLDAYSHAAAKLIDSEYPDLKQQGVDQLLKLLPRMERVMGSNHNNYLIAQINLAVGLSDLNQAPKAIEQLLSIQQQVYDKLGRENLMSLLLFDRVLAHSYANNQQLDQAESIYVKTIEILAKHHPDDLLSNIEAVLHALDFYLKVYKYPQSDKLGAEFLPIAIQGLGENHRMTLQIKAMLARTELAAGVDVAAQQLEDIYQLNVEYLGQNDHQTKALRKIIDAALAIH